MSETDIDLLPDPAHLRRSFDAAAESYDEAAVLQREVGRRLIERFELVRLAPARVLDVGAGTGATTLDLMKRYRKAGFTALDVSPRMLARARRRATFWRRPRCVAGDAQALPFADNSFDLVFSNMTLQWCGDLDEAFGEMQRVLRPEGLLMFSTLGPDTLRELREAWSEADGYSHVNAFMDMHDVGDALGRKGFSDPVMDVEHFTLTYERVRELMSDLKAIGAHNVTGGRARGLTGRRRLKAMEGAYERHRGKDGRLPATYEVVYGHAWGTGLLPRRDGTGLLISRPDSAAGGRPA
ncbi:malonyl-ACP O-methyltransferase BioC [Ectothiorhodospiraceae bacterium WFHF3C12]|nr:malonyl-ACP O-methyltransferase BioC [Ectothiorhodospiraceae bacterium WFHF3C12]